MGILEDIDAMELSDEMKTQLKESASKDIDKVKEENATLKTASRRKDVDDEVETLKQAGFAEAPGALAYYRRVMLSPDTEEPGAILLSDVELELSGDQATGAKKSEVVSAQEVLRNFVNLLPRDNEGKLKLALSDMANEVEVGDPPESGDTGDPDKKAQEHHDNMSRIMGREIKRDRKRYQGKAGAGAS